MSVENYIIFILSYSDLVTSVSQTTKHSAVLTYGQSGQLPVVLENDPSKISWMKN